MTWNDDPAHLAHVLVELKQEHRDLDQIISQLNQTSDTDQLALKRMKKRKLSLKDRINWIERQLQPDEPA